MRYLALLTFLLLAACGQAGDLYLPPEQPAPAQTTAPATPAPEPAPEEKKDEDPK